MELTVNIKKGDTIQIIAGKDRGKRGEVLKVLPRENRLVVQGLNQRKKHQRAQRAQTRMGQTAPEILIFDAPLDASNVMLVCPKCGEAVRVGHQRDESGKGVRLCRSCKSVIAG
jgi:large subunit ribosomal protein L24